MTKPRGKQGGAPRARAEKDPAAACDPDVAPSPGTGSENTHRLPPPVRNALLAALGLFLLWFAWEVRSVLNPLIAGYFLAFCVHPLVVRLERHGWSRPRAVNTIFIAAAAVFGLTGIMLFVQARKLVENAGPLLASVGETVESFYREHEEPIRRALETLRIRERSDVPASVEESAPAIPPDAPVEDGALAQEALGAPVEGVESEALGWQGLLRRLGAELFRGEGAATAGKVGLQAAESGWTVLRQMFGTGLAVLSFFLLLPIYTWFLLFELGSIHGFVRRYIPRHARARVSRVVGQIGEVLSTFFRGRLLVCVLKGLVLVVGLWIAGIDYALLLGLGGGFLSLVPFIGPFLTAVVAFLVALPDLGLVGSLVAVAIVFVTAEIVEGYVLIPKILGNSLGLHPVVVLVSVFVGGAALGMFGFLIAIPLTAALVILAREFVLPTLAELADEGEPPEPTTAAE